MIELCKDGRRTIGELYTKLCELNKYGWVKEEIAFSIERGIVQPVIAFRTRKRGKALYLISGMHGEEPAGPEAIAEPLESIIRLGEKMPIVLVPLCNPIGYMKDWRYLNQKRWEKDGNGVGPTDAELWLPVRRRGNKARDNAPSCQEAFNLSNYLISQFRPYPPKAMIDLHEDELAKAAYVYSHGKHGKDDRIALGILDLFKEMGIPLLSGETRWKEKVNNGLVEVVPDGSIEDLFASEDLIVKGQRVSGSGAETVLALELPQTLSLTQRVVAYNRVIASLPDLLRL